MNYHMLLVNLMGQMCMALHVGIKSLPRSTYVALYNIIMPTGYVPQL